MKYGRVRRPVTFLRDTTSTFTGFEEDFYRYRGIFGQGAGRGSAPWRGSPVVEQVLFGGRYLLLFRAYLGRGDDSVCAENQCKLGIQLGKGCDGGWD